MRILHVCIYFRNPMFMGLMKAEENKTLKKGSVITKPEKLD